MCYVDYFVPYKNIYEKYVYEFVQRNTDGFEALKKILCRKYSKSLETLGYFSRWILSDV